MLVQLKCPRFRNGWADSQNVSTDAVYTGCSRERCGTTYCRWWNFVMLKSICALSEVCYGSHLTMKFNIFFVNCAQMKPSVTHFRVMKFFVGDFRRHCSDSCYDSLLIVNCERENWLHLEWGVLRFTPNNKSDDVLVGCREVRSNIADF